MKTCYSAKICGYIWGKPVWSWSDFSLLEHPSGWFFTGWWLLESSPITFPALNKLWIVLSPQSGCSAVKVGPVQLINFCMGTEDVTLPLQLTFSDQIFSHLEFHNINIARRMYCIKIILESSSLGKIQQKICK